METRAPNSLLGAHEWEADAEPTSVCRLAIIIVSIL